MVERLMCHEFATSKSAASSSEVSKNLKIGKDHKPQRGSERVSLKGAGHYAMGLEPNLKKSPRIAESRFGYLRVCSLIVYCQ